MSGVNENLMKHSVIFNPNGTIKKGKPTYNFWRGHTMEELKAEYETIRDKEIAVRAIHPTLQKRYISLVKTYNLLRLEKKYVDPNSLKRTRAKASEYIVSDQISWVITIDGIMENIENEVAQIKTRTEALRAADKAEAAAKKAAAAAEMAKKAAATAAAAAAAAAVVDDWEEGTYGSP
jgi:hypothetical protein